MTVNELIRQYTLRLRSSSGEDSLFDAKSIVAFALGVPEDRLVMYRDAVIETDQCEKIDRLVDRRINREPLQYILGEWEFYGFPFYVCPGVLIPRQDTETLVDVAVDAVNRLNYSAALDLCCGTGCIGVSLALKTNIHVTFSDLSRTCIELARKNAIRNGIEAEFHTGDLFEPLTGRKFDLIMINPPYLTEVEMRDLQPELKREPALALYGGCDGVDYYRKIALQYRDYLIPGGTLLMEIGETQGESATKLFPGSELICDLNNKPRVVKVTSK